MATRVVPARLGRLRGLARELADAFTEHGLFTYASAISFRAIVALVPLVLLGLALLGALGLQDVWTESVAPPIEEKVTAPVFAGIDHTVEKIFSSGTAGLIAFATALLVWDMTWAVTTIRQALNRIHEVKESRSWRGRILIAAGLAVAVSLCLVGAALVVSAAPRIGDAAALDILFGIGRWLVAVLLLLIAVGLLVRYAPAERPEVRWASAGSVLVIAAWIVASLAFRWWVTSVADFKTAIGTLAVLLILSAYVFTSAAIFLVGVQLDELLRKQQKRR